MHVSILCSVANGSSEYYMSDDLFIIHVTITVFGIKHQVPIQIKQHMTSWNRIIGRQKSLFL